jgi:hypothetical protein
MLPSPNLWFSSHNECIESLDPRAAIGFAWVAIACPEEDELEIDSKAIDSVA